MQCAIYEVLVTRQGARDASVDEWGVNIDRIGERVIGGSRVLVCQINGNRGCCCVEEGTENRPWSWVEVGTHALWILEVTEVDIMGHAFL